MLRNIILSGSLALALTGAAVSQNADAPQRQRFELEAGAIELQVLIDAAAECLGWNILVNQAELQNAAIGGARITLQNNVATDATDGGDTGPRA